MDIQFHTVCGTVIITAKLKMQGVTRYYATLSQKNRKEAIDSLFGMIKNDQPMPTYPEFQKITA